MTPLSVREHLCRIKFDLDDLLFLIFAENGEVE
jgi:hypothetical protein